MQHPILISILLGIAVVFAFISCLGVLVMRNAYQRLNFPGVVVTVCVPLIVAAVWIDEKDPAARVKIILIALILYVMNAVLSSATAKAIRIQEVGHWEPHPEERIPVIGREEVAGAFGATEDDKA